MKIETFDYVVLGGGPAALGEAVRLNGHSVKSTVVSDRVGGCMTMLGNLQLQSYVDELSIDGASHAIERYVHAREFRNPTGAEYSRYVADNLGALGIKKIQGTVLGVSKKEDIFSLEILGDQGERSDLRSRHVVFATGLEPRRDPGRPCYPALKSCFAVYEDLRGGQLSPYIGKDVVIIGSGNSAFQLSLEVAAIAKSVTILATHYSGLFPQETTERFALRANSQRTIEVIAKTARTDTFGPLNKPGKRALSPIWLHIYRAAHWLPSPGLLRVRLHKDDNTTDLLAGSLANAIQNGRVLPPISGSDECEILITQLNTVVISAIGVQARIPETSWSGWIDPQSGFIAHNDGLTSIGGVLAAGGCAGYPSVNTMRPALTFLNEAGVAPTKISAAEC